MLLSHTHTPTLLLHWHCSVGAQTCRSFIPVATVHLPVSVYRLRVRPCQGNAEWCNCASTPVPLCTHSITHTEAVNHDGLGIVCSSTTTTWKLYKSSVHSLLQSFWQYPPSPTLLAADTLSCLLVTLLLEHRIIPLSQDGTCFFMYLLYRLPPDNCLEDTLPF